MKLAVIETITNIEPIEGADRIVRATIQGWRSVINKDSYNIGDKVVFVPIDTVIEPKEWNKFLWDKDNPSKPIKVKTKKLRGTISQGVIFPISILSKSLEEYPEDICLGEELGVTKYEKPVDNSTGNQGLTGPTIGNFPSYLISKTDEDNLLSNIRVMDELKEADEIVVTLKLDGTSATYAKTYEGEFFVCSRNLIKGDGDNAYWNMVRKYDLTNNIPNSFALQGEITAPNIQKGKTGVTEQTFTAFNYKNTDTNEYVELPNFVPHVKTIKKYTKEEFSKITVDDLQEFANIQTYRTGPAEGIVIRGFKNGKLMFSDRLRKMLSVKIINQNYKD